MSSDAHLTSITFKTDGSDLTSVQVSLSTGESSPVYERQGHRHHQNVQTINLDNNVITSVGCARAAGNNPDWLRTFKFYGVNNAELFEYNHRVVGHGINPFENHPVADNEQLIGVYGVYNV